MHHPPPRALLRRQIISVNLTSTELYHLIRLLEVQAVEAEAEGHVDFADSLLVHVAQLREAGR